MKNVLVAIALVAVSVVAYGEVIPNANTNTDGTQSVLTSNQAAPTPASATTATAAPTAAPVTKADCCCTTKCVTLSPWQTRRLVRQSQREEVRDLRAAQREEVRSCRCACVTVAVETCKCKKTCCCN